ncbi:MAG: ATP-binding protein [Bauldia sp.]|nr:ATP-binding protein [Bauldia sp.]
MAEAKAAAEQGQPSPAAVADFEKLGSFYLGREYDLAEKALGEIPILYDSKDLVTHAVCVGMTGSGKTGLCVSLIEEAAIDGIPTIAIDPKGDLANLLLTFPDLLPGDFRPWINEDDAARKQMTPDDYAGQQAESWRKGLASWGQDGERIRRLREAADFSIYTPGSTAGLPVSVLASFAAPAEAIREDRELLLERASFTASSLLGLLGVDADPVQSREHILISQILANAWAAGTDLDLAALINEIRDPKIARVGVLELDSFFPAKDRYALAISINNLLAAPSFATWLEGEALDVGKLLYGPDGKPRVSIFSIAHLSDAERMFFVSLLLNQVLAWVRSQSGTTSLRALLYMDEIFGFFPPIAEPPSKRPLLSLLKQARAFGLGVMLATQNPADLDYKGLANTGTWFLGRLQTERDKERVMEGLEGAAAAKSGQFDRARLGEILSGLGSRVFLMNNVHDDAPVIFQTRWALSYLRGPLTRDQIRVLMADQRAAAPAPAPSSAAPAPSAGPAAKAPASTRPVLPPGVKEYFAPVGSAFAGDDLVYRAKLFGSAEVRFTDRKSGIDTWRTLACLAPITDGPGGVDWNRAQPTDLTLADMSGEAGEAAFAPAPRDIADKDAYKRWAKDFEEWVYRNAVLDIRQADREHRDALVDRIRAEYAPKIERLEEKIRNLRQVAEREENSIRADRMDSIVSVGTSILGGLFGRRRVSTTSFNRAASAARRDAKSRQRVADAEEDLVTAEADLEQLTLEVEAKVRDLSLELRPTRSNITREQLALVWVPHARTTEALPG